MIHQRFVTQITVAFEELDYCYIILDIICQKIYRESSLIVVCMFLVCKTLGRKLLNH